MPQFDDKHVVTYRNGEGIPAIVLWDGITNPDTDTGDGKPKFNVRVAIPQNDPVYAELDALAQKELREGDFKGKFPANGNWPFREVDTQKFGQRFAGHVCFTAQTRLGAPTVVDQNGRVLDPINYSGKFYPGAEIALLVHAFTYNNKQAGIGFGIDGVQIINDQAPAIEGLGAGLSRDQVTGAFGSAPADGGTPGPAPAPGGAPAAPAAPGGAPAPAPAPSPAPAPAAPSAAPQPGAQPPGGVQPDHGFAQGPGAPPAAPAAPTPAGPRMTAKAAGMTYEQFREVGWTDEQMRAEGYLE